MQYVIIGNGIAGVCAAEAIRELDSRNPIVMISDEEVIPYSRPMISMVLEGSVAFEKLPIRATDFYEHLEVTPLLGRRVSEVDTAARRVRVGDKQWIPYDKLLIASGADARPWKVTGADLPRIFYMRTQADVRAKLEVLPQCRKALVLGGGLVGFKAAYGLLKRGLDVTMLITSDYPLAMQVDPAAGQMILDQLVKFGLKVEVGTSVTAFEGNGRVRRAYLSNGNDLACDLAVIGKGVLPALDFIARDSIEVDLGIVVDDHLQTNAPDVYAAGDAAESVDIARGRRWVNAIWPEAAVQGRIAGLNMAGRPVAYPGSLSRNVMRVLALDVMTIGHVNPRQTDDCEVLSVADPVYKTYRKMIFRGDVLTGAMMVNNVDRGGVLLALIQHQIPVTCDKHRLLAPGFDYAKLLS